MRAKHKWSKCPGHVPIEVDEPTLQQLHASELEVAHMPEDLISLLIEREIINFTVFPGMA